MQEVHTYRRLGVPPTMARTRWTFGFQRRRVRRCECETLLPKPGPLPQMSQTEATGSLLSEVEAGCRPGTPGPEVEGYPTERPMREPVGYRPLKAPPRAPSASPWRARVRG